MKKKLITLLILLFLCVSVGISLTFYDQDQPDQGNPEIRVFPVTRAVRVTKVARVVKVTWAAWIVQAVRVLFWSGIKWSGIKWSGIKWSRIKWSGN